MATETVVLQCNYFFVINNSYFKSYFSVREASEVCFRFSPCLFFIHSHNEISFRTSLVTQCEPLAMGISDVFTGCVVFICCRISVVMYYFYTEEEEEFVVVTSH